MDHQKKVARLVKKAGGFEQFEQALSVLPEQEQVPLFNHFVRAYLATQLAHQIQAFSPYCDLRRMRLADNRFPWFETNRGERHYYFPRFAHWKHKSLSHYEVNRLSTTTGDYRILISVIDKKHVNRELIKQGKVVIEANKQTVPAQIVAHQLAIQDAAKKHCIKKVITFHPRIIDAQRFVYYKRPILFDELNDFHFDHINGSHSAAKRASLLRTFILKERAVLTNAQCLTEGVDVPDTDMVVFTAPKRSHHDIVQAVGRAVRKAPGKKVVSQIKLQVRKAQSALLLDTIMLLMRKTAQKQGYLQQKRVDLSLAFDEVQYLLLLLAPNEMI